MNNLNLFTDLIGSFGDADEIADSQESQPMSVSSENFQSGDHGLNNSETFVPRSNEILNISRPAKGTGQYGQFRSVDEIDAKYRDVFSYPFFNLVQSSVIEDALYSDKSMVVCAPTGSGKTVVFEMAIVQLLMELEDKQYTDDFKIIYMAPVKALCTERLSEWYPKFTKLGLLCIAVTGDTDVDFSQLKPYRIIITTPEKWDMITRRWREYSQLVEVIKLFLIDEVHILNDQTRGPVLEAVVSRMKTIEASAQSAHRIAQLQKQYQGTETNCKESPPKIRFVAVSATVSNPGDVAAWLGTDDKQAVYYKFGDESRPVKLKRIVEGYPCPEGTSIFKFDIILNYKLWPVIQKYHDGKPTLIFCNTRKSVALTAEALSKELTVTFSPEQKAKLVALASTIKNKKLQALVLSGVGCHHAGLLYEERTNIEHAFRNRDLPILITTTTLAMGVNLPAHLVIIKNTQQYVNGAYQEYSISTILQMVGRAGRPQFDTEATAVIMTRLCDKQRYQALVGGSEPLQSYLHKRLAENLNSEAALGTVNDVAQCVQWVRSTFLSVRAARDPKRYLGLPQAAPQQLITKKIEELCVKAMNGLATAGLITMDEASCIESTEAGRLMSVFYLDLETMKHIMKINGSETLERLLCVICESHELSDMHLRVDERRCLNALNRNNAAATVRFPMKGKITTRQMKLNCMIQAILGCLNIPDPSLNQEAMKIMRIADRVCKCLVAYVTRPALVSRQPRHHSAVLNSLTLAKCVSAQLWENSPYVSKQLRGIGATFSSLLAAAGKVNFMLLEESHPRDLERIMNKGPPAGNVLRKQISLLPKYRLTMTPLDEKSASVQLTLLNLNHLSENMEQLTAGDSHKSYLLVGDSENNLLVLTSFKDKDLISVYDGVITHQITRKQSFEHKIIAHCISSTFVGIDAQCEYIFKSLEAHPTVNENCAMNPTVNQINTTETIKERKRKNTSQSDIAQSKEKKKRNNTLIEKFKCLKESFGKTSKNLKDDLDKSVKMSNKILQEFTQSEKPVTSTETITEQQSKTAVIHSDVNYSHHLPETDFNATEQIYGDEMSETDEEKINSILNDIENEISGCNKELDLPCIDLAVEKSIKNGQSVTKPSTSTNIPTRKNTLSSKDYRPHKALNNTKRYSHKNKKSTYDYIDLVNNYVDLSDEEDHCNNDKICGFPNAIKNQIDKYLQHTRSTVNVLDTKITDILEKKENEDNTNDTDSKIESNEKDFNENISDSKVSEKTNVLPNNNNTDVVQDEQKHKHIYEENQTANENETNTIKQLSQSNIPDNHQTVSQGKSNNNVTKHSNECSNLLTKINEETPEPSEIDNYFDKNSQNEKNYETLVMSNSSKIATDHNFDDINQNGNNYDIPVTCRSSILATGNNTAITSLTNRTPYNKNSFKENIDPRCTMELPSTPVLLRYATQDKPKFLNNLAPYRKIKCQTNPIQPRAGPSYNHSELYDPNSRQNSFIPTEYSPKNNDGSALHNQNSNIRKYSYSATKIDVTTKKNHVTVIRKIKMDVDITEINGQNDIKNSRDEKETHTINPEVKGIANKVENQGICYSKNNELNYRDRSEIKCQDYPMLASHDMDVGNKSLEAYHKNDIATKMTQRDIQDAFTETNDGKTFITLTHCTPPPSGDNTQSKPIGHDSTRRTCDSETKIDDIANKFDKKNESPQKEGNRVTGILQKYSQKLRKDKTGSLSQPLTQSKFLDKSSINILPVKPKRPFKITEIDNLKTPLTKLQLSETAKRDDIIKLTPAIDNMHGIRIIEEQNGEFNTQERTNEDIQLKEASGIDAFSISHNEDKSELVEEFSDSSLQDSDIEELESCTETDINIDQSMFNPKTLLQCFNTDDADVIVPPPPEFRDENESEPQDCNEPTSWNHLYANKTEDSIFLDESNIQLTPRKEIETWTLSQINENDNNFGTLQCNRRKSFTIMHSPRQRGNTSQNVCVSTRNKLQQFQVSRKKKLN